MHSGEKCTRLNLIWKRGNELRVKQKWPSGPEPQCRRCLESGPVTNSCCAIIVNESLAHAALSAAADPTLVGGNRVFACVYISVGRPCSAVLSNLNVPDYGVLYRKATAPSLSVKLHFWFRSVHLVRMPSEKSAI